jgi:2-polyprenyl-3-methyl-5-hydroxy-6-metoxy-1,4-benzoquinol methylase
MWSFPAGYVSKHVPLRYKGFDLTLAVSHALFSSYRVDEGTMLLLKTLAQTPGIPTRGRALDVGCGVGSLAVALAKSCPELDVEARDRSVLACAFTAENARRNGVKIGVLPALIGDPETGTFDLIVSNVPAKAGSPVLALFLQALTRLVSPQAVVAVVLVNSLAEVWGQTARDLGWKLLLSEKGPRHTVFHHSWDGEAKALSPTLTFPGAYQRLSRFFGPPGRQKELVTVWGLPNFDTEDYRLQTQQALLERLLFRDKVLVWEPVQGQSALLARSSASAPFLTLAGSDLLALKISALNLQSAPVLPCASVGDLLKLPVGGFSGVLVNLHTEPHVPWVEQTQEVLFHLLEPGGVAVVSGTSTDLARFLAAHKGLRLALDFKFRGWRSVALVRGTSGARLAVS